MTAAAIAVAVTLTLLAAAVSLWLAVSDGGSLGAAMFATALGVSFSAAGAVVAAARPSNPVGWVLLSGAVLTALGGTGADLAHHGIVVAPGSVPAVSFFAIAGSALRSVGWYLLTLVLPMVFPDGHLQPSRRNWLPRTVVVILIASVIDPFTDTQADLTTLGHWHNPIGLHRPWDLVSGVAFLAHVPLAVVAAVGITVQLIRRYRNGTPLLRQQLRLFVAAALLPVTAAPIVFTVGYNTGPWIFTATVLPLPVAVGFAVLAHGLYDLRTAANRTLVWVTLSGVVAGIYALAIAGLGNRMNARHSAWLPWVAAGVVAVAFAPLRDALQRGVNRVTFGRWDQPYNVLAALGQRLEASRDVARLLDRVVEELTSLGLRDVAVLDARGDVVAGAPVAGSSVEHPLSAFGQRVGSLVYRTPQTSLRSRDRQLLDDLAAHLGGVLHAHELTLDLQRARERLVLAREEERRRLRRDLHDGLGPSLAGHLLRLDLVASKLDTDSTAAADVDALRDDLRATMVDVRRVVEGLRPPALDELGLSGAIGQAVARLTASPDLEVDVDIEPLPALPAAVEVAAYRIVTEAVTNVVRHAGATRCRIVVVHDDLDLRVEVADDGHGLAAARPAGNGLQTMRERAEELGGRLSVSAHDGTRVVATLPLARVPAQAPRPREEVRP